VGLRLNASETVGTVLRLDRPASDANTIATGEEKEGQPSQPPPGQGPGDSARPDTLSYTALTELERCGYRFYLERVLGLPEQRAPAQADRSRHDGLEARMRGTIVHRLLESLDFARAVAPSEEDVAHIARELGVRVAPHEREELAALLSKALDTDFAARLTAASRDARPEYPFAFSLGPTQPLLTGVIDLLAREPDGGLLVVDYKSDRVSPEEDLEAVVEREYSVQRLLYALAVLSDGAPRVEIVHWFLHRPGEPIGAGYAAADKPELEDRMAKLAERAHTHTFSVSENPHRGLCLTCPGRSGLCSWGDSDTLRERVGAWEDLG
jgi:RecB family exonuclease